MKTTLMILALIWLVFPGGRNRSDKSREVALSSDNACPYSQETKRYVYIGAAKCGSGCHSSDTLGHQYEAWKISPHARAWQSLSTGKASKYSHRAGFSGDPAENKECLKCHITAAEADAASIGNTYRREDGVTCEACHKRELNPATYIPEASDCLKCHNSSVHRVPRFDFVSGCAKISHPRPQAERK